jgi:tetratricopeptide (TPR) repeat protein
MGKQKQQGGNRQDMARSHAAATVAKPTPIAMVAATQQGNMPVKWLAIILAVIVLLVNAPTLGYEYTLDDPFFTKDNPNVSRGVAAIKEFFTHAAYYGVFKHHDASYRPLMLTSFALEKDLFGFNPMTGHLINLMLFALEVVVLFSLLRSMFRQVSPYIPFFMVLLFALHPIHTEVVASIKSRDEIMGLLFAALALKQSLQYADNGKVKYLVFSGLWFFCALMSKETPIAMVLITPMTLWFFRDMPVAKIVKSTLPYVVVAAVYLVMRALFIESDGEKVVILVNNNGLMAATNYADKLATTLFIQLQYLILLVVPHPLSYDYSFSQIPIIGFSNPKALAAVAVIIGLFVYAARGFMKKDVLAFCILFYGMSVVITSNLLVDIGATMAERFIFTGSLGFCIALVWLVAKMLRVDVATVNMSNAKPAAASLLLVAVLYGGKTIARNEAWRSNLALYETGLETAPDSWRAQYLLAVEYTRQIDKTSDAATKRELYDKACAGFNRSLQILPNNADVYLLKGYADEFAGRIDSAIMSYSNVLKLDSLNTQAAVNLGGVFMRTGRLDDAITVLTPVLRRDSTNTDALTNIGAAHGNKGLFQQSIMYYEKAYKIKPDQPANVMMSMSNVYRFLGDSANAQKFRALMLSARTENRSGE